MRWWLAKQIADVSYGNISNWDVGGVTDMSGLFQNKTTFNDNISGWNTEKVTNMKEMFYGATSFNQPIDTSGSQWNVSKVNTMNDMFNNELNTFGSSFNQPIGKWDVSGVTDMYNMFNNATSFNQDISNWNVSKVDNTNSTFFSARKFNQDISTWKVKSTCKIDIYTFAHTGLSPLNKHKMTLDTSWNQNDDFKQLLLPTFANSLPSSANVTISHEANTTYTFKGATFL